MVWNAEPKDVVHMSPYVLAFTADTVEIRMASNGSLIQTIAVPDLHLLSKKVKYQPNFIAHFYLAALTLPLLPLLSPLPLLASSPSHHRATSLSYFHLKNNPASLRLVQLFQPSSKNID